MCLSLQIPAISSKRDITLYVCLLFNQRLQSIRWWLVWTYVSIVGHGLSSSLDELGHWVVWVLLPELLPLSLLLQGLPGSLPLDQGHPTDRKHEHEFDVSLRNIRCKYCLPVILPVEAQSVKEIEEQLLFNQPGETYLWRHSEKATRADRTTSHFIMSVTLLLDSEEWSFSSRVQPFYTSYQGCDSEMPLYITWYHVSAGDKKSAVWW